MHIPLNLFEDRLQSLLEVISALNNCSYHVKAEAAEAYVQEYNYEEAEAMLTVFCLYKDSPNLNPIFYLEVMNRFRIYTPIYCQLVWSWAEQYNIKCETEKIPYLGLNIAQALSNSPIRCKEAAKWVINFVDIAAANPENLNQIFTILKPKVSRAENNVSRYAFKNKDDFISHFSQRNQKACNFFFRHYYNFSHLFKNKDAYLNALNDLSGEVHNWFGSPTHK